MRNIVDCVNAFLPLLNTEYELVLGRKGVAVALRLTFDKKDCFHLMGLQYLIDRPKLKKDRGKVFDEIVEGNITTEHIETSDFYHKNYCRSFFSEEKMDYTKNQASWTLLYKKKINRHTGTEQVLYDRKRKE